MGDSNNNVRNILIPINDDSLFEIDEQLLVVLRPGSDDNVEVQAPAQATVTITNNDGKSNVKVYNKSSTYPEIVSRILLFFSFTTSRTRRPIVNTSCGDDITCRHNYKTCIFTFQLLKYHLQQVRTVLRKDS